jgi:hypothetical protein
MFVSTFTFTRKTVWVVMFAALTGLWSACKKPVNQSEVLIQGGTVGQLRGPAVIAKVIESRMGSDQLKLDIFSYTKRNWILASFAVNMGTFTGEGIKNRLENGQPNAVNMFLWERVLTNLADEFASKFCGSKVEIEPSLDQIEDSAIEAGTFRRYPYAWFNATVQAAFGSCSDVAHLKAAERKKIWSLILAEDAPDEELEAWSKWVESEQFYSLEARLEAIGSRRL